MRKRKRKNDLGQQIKECGNVTNLLYSKMYPNNDVYNAIHKAIEECEYPVLPITGGGEIAANKAFVADVKDIILEGGESVKDSICAVVDARDDMFGDFHGFIYRSDSDKIKEYYLDTSLCFGWNKTTGKHLILTASPTILGEIPIVGKNNPMKNVKDAWLNFQKYEVSRLYPRMQGYYVEKEQINLADYYICPLFFVKNYINKFEKIAKENILLLNYKSGNEDKVIKCTLGKISMDNKSNNYLDWFAGSIWLIRIYDIDSKRIVAIPVPAIISFIVLQHI